MDEDQQQQWIVVKSRKKKFIEKEIKADKVHVKGANVSYSRQINLSLEQEFLEHANTAHNRSIVKAIIKQIVCKKIQIVCLGIGNFASFMKPQLQMLFLKHCLIKQLEQSHLSYQVNIFDPIFTKDQKQEIKNMSGLCNQFKEVESQTSYVMYMPHCDRFLYEKLCQLKIKQPSSQIFVIGNSINEYKQRCLLTNEAIPSVFQSFNPKEIKIKDYKQAFNDTFIYIL